MTFNLDKASPSDYKAVFDTEIGIKVFNDLCRIANYTKIDAENVNPNSAVFKCGQIALLNRIRNQVDAANRIEQEE